METHPFAIIDQPTLSSTLPSEILAYIFHLVANTCDLLIPNAEYPDPDLSLLTSSSEDSEWEPRTSSREVTREDIFNFPNQLDRLTHVCSYWRMVAISSPSLWTHIDFVSHRSLHRKFLARAEAYAIRAAELPIEIHLADDSPSKYDKTNLRQFLSLVLHRVQSLDLIITRRWRHVHSFALHEFVSNRADATALTQLTMKVLQADPYEELFVDWYEGPDSGFTNFTVLHLQGHFPAWNSTAYLNLVDLRLLTSWSNWHWTEIEERELQNILEASPRLRILHFELEITDGRPDDESVVPVRLIDLEVLNISTYHHQRDTVLRPGEVLRLLAPGIKPLRLSILHNRGEYDYHNDEFSLAELVKLFQRSNVTKFCAKYAYPQLDTVLKYAPNLEDLALESCVFDGEDGELARNTPVASRLNSLILFDCAPSLDQLEALLQRYPANLLVLCKRDWDYMISSELQKAVRPVLESLERYPGTKLVMQSFNPTINWNFID